MPRSDDAHRSVDWRGWLMVAWVAWFGVLYGRMVVVSRGDRLRAAVTSSPSPSTSPAPSPPESTPATDPGSSR